MLIAARSVGSDEGYIYCRAEHPPAIKRLKLAIAQAEEYGIVGENIPATALIFTSISRKERGFVCAKRRRFSFDRR